jgi:hypothetical protein
MNKVDQLMRLGVCCCGMVFVETKEQFMFSGTMLGGDEKNSGKLCKAPAELSPDEQLRRCYTIGSVGTRAGGKKCETGEAGLDAT